MLYDPYNLVFLTISTRKMSSPMGGPAAAAQTAADEAFEREKAAIISYEDGWDRWDGPIWPVGYVQCRMREFGPVLNPHLIMDRMADETFGGVEADDYVWPGARNTDEGGKTPESE
ncbi:hypothetical protein yc1106_06577 [Curvularia clavata]|uniref:Uncharacterized protein n=1 Tax=Curvularia clavata TaxID=95742 RepID=A0A9Q8ZEK3_CURCL|nr:hypothetical protein yc1106_06577 [Curvularia clavata]